MGGHGDGEGNARSDTMMLVYVNPATYQIGIVTVPRDTASTNSAGQTVKINDAYQQGGIEGCQQAVTALTGVTPKYYFDMTFVQFEDFVNNMDGVSANVPIAMSLVDIVGGETISLDKGDQPLNGAQALVLARVRKQYKNDQDACRQIQDRQIVQSLLAKVSQQPSDMASTYANILTAGSNTNISADELRQYAEIFMQHADAITFQSGTGPYDGAQDASADGLWLATRDEDTWKQVVSTVEAGGDPTTVVALPKIVAN